VSIQVLIVLQTTRVFDLSIDRHYDELKTNELPKPAMLISAERRDDRKDTAAYTARIIIKTLCGPPCTD